MNVVIIVIAPTIGNTNELVAPTSVPPLATTTASSPPEGERPKGSFKRCLGFISLRPVTYISNFAPIDTKISNNGWYYKKSGNCVMSIKAPTETKEYCTNMFFNWSS